MRKLAGLSKRAAPPTHSATAILTQNMLKTAIDQLRGDMRKTRSATVNPSVSTFTHEKTGIYVQFS